MVDDGWYTAVLDRTEDDEAVLVLERSGRAVDDLVVPLDALPCEARVPDAVLCVRVESGALDEAIFDPRRTVSRRDRARRRFARLSRRLSTGDDGRTMDDVRDDDGRTMDDDRDDREQ